MTASKRHRRANTSSTLPRSMRGLFVYTNIISNSVSLCPEISKKVCLSPTFFSTAFFKSVKGITPSEYLLEQRIISCQKAASAEQLLALRKSQYNAVSEAKDNSKRCVLKIIPESRRKNIVTKNRLLFDLQINKKSKSLERPRFFIYLGNIACGKAKAPDRT